MIVDDPQEVTPSASEMKEVFTKNKKFISSATTQKHTENAKKALKKVKGILN